MLTDNQIIQKADLALSDITSDGGLLHPTQFEQFVRTLIDQPTILNEARVVRMPSPKYDVNKIKFGSRILQYGSQNTAASDTEHSGRYLTQAGRSKPTTSKVQLDAKEVMAEVRIPYEVLEDNIERDQLGSTILALIAERAALDMEELIIKGDTASSDTYLALFEGLLEQATSNVVNAAGSALTPQVLNNVKKAMPTPFRRNPAEMRYYVNMDDESDYRLGISSRGSNLGDAVLVGNQPLQVFGSLMKPAAMMTAGYAVYTNPANIVFGIHRDVRIEMDRDIRSREIIYVLSARIDMKLEEETAVVKVTNLA